MLCESCAAHFSFSRPDIVQHILYTKRLAFEAAKKGGLDEALVQSLQEEFERYQSGAEAKNSFNYATPCPCNMSDRNEYSLYTGVGFLSIWNSRYHERILSDLEGPAKPGNCQMCEAIVTMTQYATGTGTPGNQTVTSTIFLNDATCRPAWLRVDVVQDGTRVAMLSFHISIEDVALGQ